MWNFFAIFGVIVWSNHSLDGVLEDDISQLIAGKQDASQGSAICGKDQDLFCKCTISFSALS